MTPVADINAYS